jgi:hypothetical protein
LLLESSDSDLCGATVALTRASRNGSWEIGANGRSSQLLIGRRIKGHGTVQSADPDFGGASVEVEGAFFVDFRGGIGGGKDLDTDLWSACEKDGIGGDLGAVGSQPSDVYGLDAVDGRERALGKDQALSEQFRQTTGNVTLATGVTESWRRTHEDASEAIGLDAIGELGELRISQDLGPARQVEAGLRGEVRKLDSDRHGTKIVVLSLGSKRGRARDVFFGGLFSIVS